VAAVAPSFQLGQSFAAGLVPRSQTSGGLRGGRCNELNMTMKKGAR